MATIEIKGQDGKIYKVRQLTEEQKEQRKQRRLDRRNETKQWSNGDKVDSSARATISAIVEKEKDVKTAENQVLGVCKLLKSLYSDKIAQDAYAYYIAVKSGGMAKIEF
jgi:predicted methyltransferase